MDAFSRHLTDAGKVSHTLGTVPVCIHSPRVHSWATSLRSCTCVKEQPCVSKTYSLFFPGLWLLKTFKPTRERETQLASGQLTPCSCCFIVNVREKYLLLIHPKLMAEVTRENHSNLFNITYVTQDLHKERKT
jgi:hypothetical protein